jgi:hypothetical protein
MTAMSIFSVSYSKTMQVWVNAQVSAIHQAIAAAK